MLDKILGVAFGSVLFGTFILDDALWMADMNAIDRDDIGETVLLTLGKWSIALRVTTGTPQREHHPLRYVVWPRAENTGVQI